MIKRFLLTIVIGLIFFACKTNDEYDASLCQSYINKYCYETAFIDNSAEYDASLKTISQEEFYEMIGQLKGIVTEATTELQNISALESRTEMRKQYVQFNDKIMLQQFKNINGLVDDANWRGLLDSNNKKAYEDLKPLMENISSIDVKIKKLIH